MALNLLASCLHRVFEWLQLEMVPLLDAQQAAVGAGAATTSGAAAAAKAATATATTSTDGSPANGAAGSKGASCINLVHVNAASTHISSASSRKTGLNTMTPLHIAWHTLVAVLLANRVRTASGRAWPSRE
jgi:hypothetical protein